MANQGAKIRDIVLGIILLAIGGLALISNFGLITFNESTVTLWFSYGLAGLGGLLLIFYLFSPKNVWLFIVALCSVFLAAAVYISNFMPGQDELVGVALFLLLAFAFLAYFVVKPSQWWPALVGWICIGLAATVYTNTTTVYLPWLRNLPSSLLPPLTLFASICIGFLIVWIIRPRGHWWALLTAGMIAAVASVIIMDAMASSSIQPPIVMFAVAGFVFMLIWLLRNDEYRLGWAFYPGLVLLCLAAFLYLVAFWTNNGRLVTSLIFIVLGVLFLLNYIRQVVMSKGGDAAPAPEKSSSVKEFSSDKKEMSDEEFWGEKGPDVLPDTQATQPEERESLLAEEAADELEEEPLQEEKEEVRPPVDYPIDSDNEEEKKE